MKRSSLTVLLLFSFLISSCSMTKKACVDDVYKNAKLAYDQQDYETSKKHYQEFLDRNPDSGLREVALYYLASSYQETGYLNKAASIYQNLIEHYQNDFWTNSAKEEVKSINKILSRL